MEAVIAIIRNLLKNMRVVLILGVVLGLILGLILGWGIWPVQWTNATPQVLRTDLQEDYMRMAIDAYNRTGDIDTANSRWKEFGDQAAATLGRVQQAPQGLDPNAIMSFRTAIEALNGPVQVPAGGSEQPADAPTNNLVLYASIIVVLGLLAVGLFYIYRLLRKNSGPVTAVMQAAEASRHAERTDFQSLGLAPPITQTMTTYVLGDDLYDESFSIDTGGGEFLGEYGVGVSETIGVGEPKKVAALEIWLFDKNDIKTATKVLMSEHAYNDPNIRARLEPKGELIVVKPQEQVLLETATLQLLATVVDMEYGVGAAPQKSYFERITLELAVWPRSGQ